MPGFPPGVHLIGGRNAAPVLAEQAREFYAPLIPIVLELRKQGLSLRAIGRELDRRGIRTRQVSSSVFVGIGPDGKTLWNTTFLRWNAAQVRRILLRADAQPETTPPGPRSPPVPAVSPEPADVELWVGIRRGPLRKTDIRAMLAAGDITLETRSRRIGSTVWRPLRELFPEEKACSTPT